MKVYFENKESEGYKVAVYNSKNSLIGYVVIERAMIFAPFQSNVTFPSGTSFMGKNL